MIKNSCAFNDGPSSSLPEIIHLGSPSSCMNTIKEPLDRIHHQHLTQLQNMPFQELQISFEQNMINETDLPLYETAVMQAFSPPQAYHSSYLPALSPTDISVIDEKSPPPLSHPHPPELVAQNIPYQPDNLDSPRFPINDYNYYKEIEDYLKLNSHPPAASEQYKAQIRKRARHYLILNNELYHNPNKPKKVIMRKDSQTRILELSHVSKQKGIHMGIRKMMDLISEPYFWRGMYEDISNYVNTCPKCRDNIDVAQRLEKERNRDLMCFDGENVDCYKNLKIDSTAQTSSNVWTNVEVQLHGPFKQTTLKNELVVTITDPESCFVHAAALPACGCPTLLTDFIVKTFYTFGFPKSYLVLDKKMFETVSAEFNSKLKYSSWKTKLIWKESTECTWVGQLIDLLVRRKSEKWDTEIEKFMFQFRIGAIRDAFFTPTDSVPFYSMFNRSPYVEDKENFCRKIHKKKKTSIQCQKCDDNFTSKILFRQHCKRHLLEESKVVKEKNTSSEDDALPFDVVEENVTWAVGEIKNYLTETKDSRRKRGKYQRYSVEIQEHMICYALKNGAMKAADYFTQLMGSPVSDSTIRNLIRSSKHFQPRVKEDIARYAVDNGVEKASEHFSRLLNKDVSIKLVKKFKSIYSKRLGLNKKDEWVSCARKSMTPKIRSITSLTDTEKEEIGRYSSDNAIEDTINHFKQKFKVFLNEENVYDYHKIYTNKQSCTTSFEELSFKENIICPSVSLQIQNDCDYTLPTINIHSLSSKPDITCAGPKTSSDSNLPQIFISQENNSLADKNYHVQQEALSGPSDWNIRHDDNSGHKRNTPSDSDSENEETLDSPSSSSSFSKLSSRQKSKCDNKKRGKYITYSPEMRAKIGKYAAEIGSGKASKYFSKVLGHDLAESTARGLKDKYLKKIKQCDVTSLGYSPRGRPLRLGKYDEVVQECLKEMVRSGERLTAFLVITTAKKIVSKLEPGLLKENGGSVVLNNTWAKSFLKRICVRNNT